MRRWALLAAVPILGGCGLVIGEWFGGYSEQDASDGGSDEDAPAADGGGADAAPHTIDDCTPTFALWNGITYPTSAPIGDLTVADAGNDLFNTDGDPRCWSGASSICVVVARTVHVTPGATLATFGNRPLAIVAVHDLTVDQNGVINIAGGDQGGVAGPGDHEAGTASARGGAGGGAEPGMGNACDAGGGSAIATPGFVGGGHGGGMDHPRADCQLAGLGGGALELVSLCGKITINGTVNGAGGGGGGGALRDNACPEGLGGGAGGNVWIQAGPNQLDVGLATGGLISVAGGGGGGGACSTDDGGTWTGGGSGFGESPGDGGVCPGGGTLAGGPGGVGGDQPSPPFAGGAPIPGTGVATCGGGGGGVGWLFIQGSDCTPGITNGICRSSR
jgi:hypothetical protein